MSHSLRSHESHARPPCPSSSCPSSLDYPWLKAIQPGTSLAIQWLGLCTFTAEGLDLIPGQEIKNPQVAWYGQKNTKERYSQTWQLMLWLANTYIIDWSFPCDSIVRNPPANEGGEGSIPGSGRSPEEGNGNPLQYSCLGNPMDRGAWWATVHGGRNESDVT